MKIYISEKDVLFFPKHSVVNFFYDERNLENPVIRECGVKSLEQHDKELIERFAEKVKSLAEFGWFDNVKNSDIDQIAKEMTEVDNG